LSQNLSILELVIVKAIDYVVVPQLNQLVQNFNTIFINNHSPIISFNPETLGVRDALPDGQIN
jgi:hypothetical protein